MKITLMIGWALLLLYFIIIITGINTDVVNTYEKCYVCGNNYHCDCEIIKEKEFNSVHKIQLAIIILAFIFMFLSFFEGGRRNEM